MGKEEIKSIAIANNIPCSDNILVFDRGDFFDTTKLSDIFEGKSFTKWRIEANTQT